MSQNKRQQKRVHLIYYLRILDTGSGMNIGHLVDITTRGIMMISEEPVTVGRDFSFRMQVPASVVDKEEINFQAHCLWCKKDFNPDFYLSGYRIEEISQQKAKNIADLINTYGFKSK